MYRVSQNYLMTANFSTQRPLNFIWKATILKKKCRGTQRQFSENICSEDDLRSRIFGTFVENFVACLPLLGFSNI